MKIFKKYIIFFLLLQFTSCVNDEKFTGSPVGVIPVVTIDAIVSTTATFALPSQEIDFTVTLPNSFRSQVSEEVTVEATTTTIVGGVRKASVVIPAGQNQATGKIQVGGGLGSLFNSSCKLNLSAIKIKNDVVGTQYLLKSNIIDIVSGNTSVPDDNDRALTFKIGWENKSKQNFIGLKTRRDKSVSLTFTKASASGSGKVVIGGVPYNVSYNAAGLGATVNQFYNDHNVALSLLGITVSAVNNSLIFDFPNNPPTVTFTRNSPITASTLAVIIYKEGTFNPINLQSKDFLIYKSQKLNVNNTLAPEGDFSAFNPGTYIFSIGATNAADLEFNPTPALKYRIVVKFPDNSTQIFDGVYNNLVPSSTFKDVFKIVKTGTGENSIYTLTNLNP